MEKKLRVGMIGVGGMGMDVHVPAYKRLDTVEIVAVCDIDQARLDLYAERYGAEGVRFYKDYIEMLDDGGLDIVDIAGPNWLHSAAAIAALERGIHTFTEKPDAISVAEAEKMKAAAEKTGSVLMVMRNNRYRQTMRYLKKYIEDEKMGEIYCGRCAWNRMRGIPGRGGMFTTKSISGGGPLIDLGVHMIDLAMWLMGNPKPVAVTGCTYNKIASQMDLKQNFDVEDLAMGFVRFENGACLQISFSFANNLCDEFFVELCGTKAGASLMGHTLKIKKEEYGEWQTIELATHDQDVPGIPCGAHHRNIHHFVDVVLGKAEPEFIPEQGLNMVKILEGIYTSAQTGKEVLL